MLCSSETSYIIVGKEMKKSKIKKFAENLGFKESKQFKEFKEDFPDDISDFDEYYKNVENDENVFYEFYDTINEFLNSKYKLEIHIDADNDTSYIGDVTGVDYHEKFEISNIVKQQKRIAKVLKCK